MDFDETWMKYSMSLTCFKAFWSGWIQGGAKTGHLGSPSSKNFFFRLEGHSNKPNAYCNDLEACGKKRCYFWFHLDIVILPYFNAISIDFFNAI